MSVASEELDNRYLSIVDMGVDRNRDRTAEFDQFRALLDVAGLPRTHPYWQHYYYYRCRHLHRAGHAAEALQVANEGAVSDPSYPGIWLWKGAVEHRLGHLLSAFMSFRKALQLGEHVRYAGPQIVDILLRKRRYEAAAKLGRELLSQGVAEDALFGAMSEVELVLGNPIASLSHLDNFEKRSGTSTSYTESLRMRARRLQAHYVRHIGIAGMSYVGSTLLGTILGSLPQCAHAGETQELIYAADPKSYAFRIIDFERDLPETYPHCRICGENCQVFDRQFRAELARDPVDWYFRIGRRVGSPILISSDKFLSEYQLKDPLSRYDLIILYKPLESWVGSHRREQRRKEEYGVAISPDADDLDKVLDEWVANYYGFLKELRPHGRTIVLQWERFAERPQEHLAVIARTFGLSGETDSVLENIRKQHYFGGNDSLETVLAEGRVVFRKPPPAQLSPEDRDKLARHSGSREVLEMLENRYWSDFRQLA